jgi:hypothetical protein
MKSTAKFSRVVLLCFAGVIFGFLAGCGPQTLETTSVEKLESSLTALREPMVEAERAHFEESLRYLVGEGAVLQADDQPQHAQLVLDLYKPLAGMTAEGIVAEARRRRLDEVQSAIAELEVLRDSGDVAPELLDVFKLQAARVYKRNRGFLEWPVIEFKAENTTEHPIWLIHFRAALVRPGYEEPWLVEEFDQLVLNGIAPGERDLWRIEPEYQEWVTLIDPHPDFQFTLEVMRLEGLGGEVIAATRWGDIEATRLAIFEKTLEQMRSTGGLALDRPPRGWSAQGETPSVG